MDELARNFWDGCADGELRYQRCGHCERSQFYPRPFCTACGHQDLSWLVSAGFGTLYSHAEVIRSPSPEFETLVPYTMALVDLDEGVRMMGHAAPDLTIGARVKATFREHQGRFLPFFELA